MAPFAVYCLSILHLWHSPHQEEPVDEPISREDVSIVMLSLSGFIRSSVDTLPYLLWIPIGSWSVLLRHVRLTCLCRDSARFTYLDCTWTLKAGPIPTPSRDYKGIKNARRCVFKNALGSPAAYLIPELPGYVLVFSTNIPLCMHAERSSAVRSTRCIDT